MASRASPLHGCLPSLRAVGSCRALLRRQLCGYRLDSSSATSASEPSLRLKLTRRSEHAKLAFAFDIDGVLVRGSKPLDSAKRALQALDGDNSLGIKIPFILLTNGGGSKEEDRCQKLSEQLGHEIHPTQFVQSHTILKDVVQDYADRPVLILGGRDNEIREVAENYGFKRVYTPLDIFAQNPSIWPFYEMTPAQEETVKPMNFDDAPIAAVFVFHDPRNWALDTQILCDVLMSGGVPGRAVRKNINLSDPPVKLFFCNPDVLWKSDYDLPRLGQGAFKAAFQAVFKAVSGGSKYPYVQYGKPTKATYDFAEKILQIQANKLYGETLERSKIYMVGDNPESDIAGANSAHWSSILVRTGVYDPERGPPAHRPTLEAQDAHEAVLRAIRRDVLVIAFEEAFKPVDRSSRKKKSRP